MYTIPDWFLEETLCHLTHTMRGGVMQDSGFSQNQSWAVLRTEVCVLVGCCSLPVTQSICGGSSLKMNFDLKSQALTPKLCIPRLMYWGPDKEINMKLKDILNESMHSLMQDLYIYPYSFRSLSNPRNLCFLNGPTQTMAWPTTFGPLRASMWGNLRGRSRERPRKVVVFYVSI